MAGFYQVFTTARATRPDPAQLQAQLRALDASAGVMVSPDGTTFTVKKNTTWTGPQITAVQNVVNTAPTVTPQSVAQAEIDAWPLTLKALVLALIDKINDMDANTAALLAAVNVLNTKTTTAQTTLPNATAPVTPAQALNAVRVKAGTL